MEFEHAIRDVTSVVNFIHARGLKHRKLQEYLKEMKNKHKNIPYHTKVHWLSRGNILSHFAALKYIIVFLGKEGEQIPELEDEQWLRDLAFLTDISSHLNALNTALQGKDNLILDMVSTVFAFQGKLCLFTSQLQTASLAHFTTCQKLLPNGKNQKSVTAT